MKDLELSAEMHCRSCEQRLLRALRGLDGVRSVETDLRRQRVAVAFDEELVDESQVRRTVAGAMRHPGIG